jgi:hypothetical protein
VIHPPRAPGIIAWFLLAALFLASVYRAATISISMDEAFTYLSFVAPPLKQILSTYSPNNHVLYSVLAKGCVTAFRASELPLRLPALAGAVLCLTGIRSVSRALLGGGWIMLLSVSLAALNPIVFDYFSQARGYGLALGFYLFGLLCAAHSKRFLLAGALLGLSIGANLTFAIPVAALDVLLVVLWVAHKAEWRPIAWMLAIELILAGGITGGPLLHANRESFAGGFGSVSQALDNFAVSCVAHDWDGNGLWTNQLNVLSDWIFRVFRIIFPLVIGVAAIFLLGRFRQFNIWLFVLTGTLVLTIVTLIAAHWLWGAPYPYARFVMYCWPLWALLSCVLVERLPRGRAFLLAFCLIMTAQSALQFDLDHFAWLEYSAGTRQIANFIRHRTRADSAHQVNISASGSLYACLDFYRSIYALGNWRLSVRSSPQSFTDYLVMDRFDAPKGLPHGFRQIWRDPLSRAVVAAPEVNGR